MKYAFDVHLELSTNELYELQSSLKKKLKQELFGYKVTEKRLQGFAGKGSMNLDNILLCELNSAQTRVNVLEDLIEQIQDAFASAQVVDSKTLAKKSPLPAGP